MNFISDVNSAQRATSLIQNAIPQATLSLLTMLVLQFCCQSPVTASDPLSTAQRIPVSNAANPSTDELERYCLSLINDSRKTGGLPVLQQDSALSGLARKYAEYMLAHPEHYVRPRVSPHLDLEGHIPMDRARAAGITTEVHENLGMGTRGAKTDYELVYFQHKTMMSEPDGQHNHKSIILDAEAHGVGIGIARGGRYFFLVEEFGH